MAMKPQRWVLCIEQQRCIWTDPKELPEVDIAYASVLGSYLTKEAAIDALTSYLRQVESSATWADVRLTEECADCGKDFNAADWHKALALSLEQGSEECPEILEVEYPARFCPQCAPAEASWR
jgi:hypothetical protein